MKNDIGRKLLPSRFLEPPGTKSLPEQGCRRIEFSDGCRLVSTGPWALPAARTRIYAKPNCPRAAQNFSGGWCEREATVTGDIRRHQTLRDELAERRDPAATIELGADAKRLQPIVAKAEGSLFFFKQKTAYEMTGAKPLSRTINSRKGLL